MSVGLTPLSSLSDQQVRAAFTRVMPLICFEQQRRQRKGLPMARHQPKHAAKAFNRFQVQRGLLRPFPGIFIPTLPSSAGGSELALISSLQSASHQHEPRGEGEHSRRNGLCTRLGDKELQRSPEQRCAAAAPAPLLQPGFGAGSTGCAQHKLLGSLQSRISPAVQILSHASGWETLCFGSELNTDSQGCSHKVSVGRTLQGAAGTATARALQGGR